MTLPLWTSLTTIFAVWLVVAMAPGPNFFATIYTATTQSRRLGLYVSAGIAVGTTIWATASLAGLGILFQTTAWLYQAVKLAGGLYLVYLGIRTILSARHARTASPVRLGALSPLQAFRRGLVVDLSNPKAAIFFTSVFAVAVPPQAPLWFQALVVATVVMIAAGWYALVACLVNLPPVAAALRRAHKAMSYVTGFVFVALGARLATDR
ncbi:LysE family translocator [Kaustia mangrovi]|uniref:LysE family translocator n=1 Tax=Kaustia mangrovi TaxID=2593653 RepID=A0A7S8HCC5_9HYPH|nr:LysE family translocator [Kaustia mangrovi]QPC43093.1 LysE family translocator [Kaustia mangrovi]